MAVDAREFSRALESVCDIFKIPSLYNEQEKCLEALFRFFLGEGRLYTGYLCGIPVEVIVSCPLMQMN